VPEPRVEMKANPLERDEGEECREENEKELPQAQQRDIQRGEQLRATSRANAV